MLTAAAVANAASSHASLLCFQSVHLVQLLGRDDSGHGGARAAACRGRGEEEEGVKEKTGGEEGEGG